MGLPQLIYLISLVCWQKPVATEIFAGTTPCNNIIRPIHQIAEEPDCQLEDCKCVLVEWKLTLNYNSAGQPTTFKLSGINRYTEKETNMYSQPGTKTETSGTWTIITGAGNRNIYRLNPDKAELALDILKLNDNLLHILDKEGKLLIGNEFFSYSLNRLAN